MSCTCDVCTSGDDPRYIGMACRAAIKRDCPFCGGAFADGMVVHSWRCEWCTTVQRVARLDDTLQRLVEGFEFLMALLKPAPPKENDARSESVPDTQRSAEIGRPHCYAHAAWREHCALCRELCPEAADRSEPHPDARPTEPAGAPEPGADPSGAGP